MVCPVLQLCKGSCMFLEGEFFAQSCANEFAFNMGIMMAAVWWLTRMVVVGMENTGRVESDGSAQRLNSTSARPVILVYNVKERLQDSLA